MSFSAATSQTGFKLHKRASDHEIMLLPGDPGVTFYKGDWVALSGGVLIAATDSLANTIGRVTKTTVCPAASQAFPIPGPGGGIGDLDGAAAKTLIPVQVDVPVGTKIWRSPIRGYQDEACAAAWDATYRSVGLTTGFGTDNYGIGSLVYVYDGPGKGELNIVEDYDHADHASGDALAVVFHRAFNTAPTTDTKMIFLNGKNASGDGRSCILGRMDIYDKDQLDLDDGYDDGNYITFMDFLDSANHLKDECVLSINATQLIAAE